MGSSLVSLCRKRLWMNQTSFLVPAKAEIVSNLTRSRTEWTASLRQQHLQVVGREIFHDAVVLFEDGIG